MNISRNFNRFYWSAIIKDIMTNVSILNWNGVKLNISRMSKDDLHELFKIIHSINSLKDLNNKQCVEYLESIRLILAESGYSLSVDDEEWEYTIKQYKER